MPVPDELNISFSGRSCILGLGGTRRGILGGQRNILFVYKSIFPFFPNDFDGIDHERWDQYEDQFSTGTLALVFHLFVQDIAGRVIAEGLKPEETFMDKVMTWNPVFVMSNSSAIEALQKMVQGFLVIYFVPIPNISICCQFYLWS